MDKTIADILMKKMLSISKYIDDAGELTKDITNEKERYDIRKGIAGVVYTEVMMPNIKQYPELDPDK